MTKRQLIDEIITINPTAQPGFLAGFRDADLGEYLAHLNVVKAPLLTGDAARYRKYFAKSAPVAAINADIASSAAPCEGAPGEAGRQQMDTLPTLPASSVDDEGAQSCTPLSPQAAEMPAVAINVNVAAADVGAIDFVATTAGVSSGNLPSSDDVADVVWEDNQAFEADEAMERDPSLMADGQHDDNDGESQNQLATVAAKLDLEKDEAPFAGNDSEAESYLF